MIDLDTFTKMPKNVGDLGKLIVAKGFKKLPKSNKSPNLVTLSAIYLHRITNPKSMMLQFGPLNSLNGMIYNGQPVVQLNRVSLFKIYICR